MTKVSGTAEPCADCGRPERRSDEALGAGERGVLFAAG